AIISAFSEPDAPWLLAEMLPVIADGHGQLRFHRTRRMPQVGKESVGGSAGDDLEIAGLLEFPETVQEIAIVTVEDFVAPLEKVPVHGRQVAEIRIVLGPGAFFFRQLAQSIDVIYV